jgi:GT2 family glycosyltransferase
MTLRPRPGFSVVVPTHGRPAGLSRCLGALARLEPPAGGFEVIVVDDHGGLDLGPVLASHGQALHLTLLSPGHGGPAAARNAGARRARGEILAFVDDDCAPHGHWLRELEAGLARHRGAACGGHARNALADNPFSQASQMLNDYLYQAWNRPGGSARFLASNNLAVPRRAFWRVGGFDERFPGAAGEDRDFCRRWRQAGRPLIYWPAAVVDHFHRLSLASFLRQQYGYGRGGRLFHERASGDPVLPTALLSAPPSTLEPWRFYLDLLGYPWRSAPRRRLLLTLLFGLAQGAVAWGFAAARPRPGPAER